MVFRSQDCNSTGFRIHQGKKGCTPKGNQIPKYDEKYQWEVEDDRRRLQPATKRVVKKENVPDSTSTKTEKNYAAAEPAANEEDKSPNETAEPHFSVKELAQMFSANTAAEKAVQPKKYHREELKQSQVKLQVQTMSTAPVQGAAAAPQEENRKDQNPSQVPNPRSAVDQIGPAAKTTEDPKASCESAQLPDSTYGIKVKKLAQMFTAQETAVRPKKKHKEEPKQSKVMKLQVQTFSTAPVQGAAAAPQEENRKDQNPSQVPNPRSAIDQIVPAAKTTEDPKASCESAQLPDSTYGIKVKKLAQMFTAQETAIRPKKKHKEEPKQSKVKLQVQTLSTAPVQGAAAAPQEENRTDQNPSQVPDPRSALDQISPAAKTTEDPKASCESAQLPDSTTGNKEKKLAQTFTAQETAVRPKKKHKEEPKLPEPQPQRRPSIRSLETTIDMQDRTTDDLKQKIQMTEETTTICTSAVRAWKPCQGSLDLDAVWPEIDGVFSEVMKTVEGAKQKSIVLPLPSLRATTITMMKQIQQKLDKLASVELKCISKFAVDVKLDPNTAHRCLVSADGMKVSGDNQEACDTPGSFGSVLGLESLVNGRFYWEVEVSNKTGWDLGVARGDANRKGKLAVKTDYGFWVTAHYENQEYAALTAPPVCLYLKDKPEKVGVFVDFEECLVSFYNVTAQSHIYSFTECLFAGEIFPYFSVHQRQDGSNADPLTISPVKRQ
ncbi:hypothetical protein Q5P01_002447 [Channa striata]|uniref:B30.2/SPRY domain-containing protein n=1 Tax=Channa striata TaxID=64152 RepID=A0AA88NUB7_CHASR|nr:hypothetical protein Q5P01_002447 [Channa striata]